VRSSGSADIPVVAAVIARDGRYLVGRRPPEKRHGGLWEFPGGKLDPGEDWLAAVRRELREELRMEARALGALLLEVHDPESPFIVRFVEVDAVGEPAPVEHSSVGWFTPEELATLRLAPADARFVSRLRAGPPPSPR